MFTFLYIIVVAVVYARYFVLSLYLKFKVNCESISTPSHLAAESFVRLSVSIDAFCDVRSEIFSFNENQWLYILIDCYGIMFNTFFSLLFSFTLPMQATKVLHILESLVFFFVIIGRLLWQHSRSAVIAGACRKSDRVSYSKLHVYMISYIDTLYPL